MDVGRYAANGAFEQNPYLTAKVVGKKATGKILEARPVKTPKFDGLFLTVKIAGKKYAYPLSFERFDIGAVCDQMGSTDTDDWIGGNLVFTGKKGKTKNGKAVTFVNVARVKTKKQAKKGKK